MAWKLFILQFSGQILALSVYPPINQPACHVPIGSEGLGWLQTELRTDGTVALRGAGVPQSSRADSWLLGRAGISALGVSEQQLFAFHNLLIPSTHGAS